MNSWSKSTPEADVELGRKLASAGAVHGKFLRMITITCDITAPLYWWKEFDTYKVGTVANSCSTMHTLTNRKLEIDDFETEGIDLNKSCLLWVLDMLNDLIEEYKANPKNNTETWRALIAMLPSCYLQKRTVMLNYEVLRRIVKDRTGHKLKEWKYFIEAMSALPYYTEFILGKTGEECRKESVENSLNLRKCIDVVAEKFNSKYACENRLSGLNACLNHIDEVTKSFNNFNNSILGKTGTEFISNDPINPAHYKDHCSIECIEAMEIAFGSLETAYFCLCNAFKYLWRHKHKNGQEDIKKAIWYLDKAEELGGDEEKINDLRNTVEKYMEEEE
jgi:hypothetical protein